MTYLTTLPLVALETELASVYDDIETAELNLGYDTEPSDYISTLFAQARALQDEILRRAS